MPAIQYAVTSSVLSKAQFLIRENWFRTSKSSILIKGDLQNMNEQQYTSLQWSFEHTVEPEQLCKLLPIVLIPSIVVGREVGIEVVIASHSNKEDAVRTEIVGDLDTNRALTGGSWSAGWMVCAQPESAHAPGCHA